MCLGIEMSVARVMALCGIGVALIFLLIIIVQYLVNSKRSEGALKDDRREGIEDSKHDD